MRPRPIASAASAAETTPRTGAAEWAGASPARPQAARNLTVDGLRGIAALLVVVYHLVLNIEPLVKLISPTFLGDVYISLGVSGVRMFFVLSGFVIAMSVLGAPLSARYVGLFALRRSLRLDPPYWVAIALAITLAEVSALLFRKVAGPADFSMAQVVAHLFYLQDILGFEQISAVFWTLCLEIQFYLVLVVLLTSLRGRGDAQAGPDLASSAAINQRQRWVIGLLALVSCAIDGLHLDLPVKGLFLPYWHIFALGVFTCWCMRGQAPWGWWLVLVLGELAVLELRGGQARLVPLATALVLLFASRLPLLTAGLHGRACQYFGRLSYSLYLMHPLVGWSSISLGRHLLGGDIGLGQALMLFGVGVAASIVSADLLYRLVERPAISLSKRVRLPGAVGADVAHATQAKA